MPNPYNYTNVVTDPGMFFGREAVLKALCTRLRNMQSTSVVGLRRIGKSSLLFQLVRTLPDRLGRDYVPLYIDLQDPHYRTVPDFVQTIAVKLSQGAGADADLQAIGASVLEWSSRQSCIVRLRQMLETSFDESELRTLCFDLGVEYDILPGEGTANKSRELVRYLERRGRIHDLVEIGIRLRPDVSWGDVSEVTEGTRSTRGTALERLRGLFKAKQSRGKLHVGSVTDMVGFFEMLDDLNDHGIRPVLCIDEFEDLMRHPEEFNDDFLEALRSLGGYSKLAMVTASRRPLIELVRAGQLTSPFHNIFSQIELGLLEPEASQALRHVPFERQGIVPLSEHEVLIAKLGGRHPFFVQMACHHLYEALPEPQDARADMLRERFNREAESHFDQLWNRLDACEQSVLKGVVGQGSSHTVQAFSLKKVQSALKALIGQVSPSGETERVLRRLARLGVVEPRDSGWQPFSWAFAEYVRQSLTPKRR